MLTDSTCLAPGSTTSDQCCEEVAKWCVNLHNGEGWHGHSCYWDSFPGGMSALLRGLVVSHGGLLITDLESFTTGGGLPANRTFQNFEAEGALVPLTHSQATTAMAKIVVGSRTDTGTANITIDQLKLQLFAYWPVPYMRATLGTSYVPPMSKASSAGDGVLQGQGKHVYYRVIPQFRLTINSLSVTTPGSTAWTLNGGQSPATVMGQYAGRHQYGVPDFAKCFRIVSGVQAIAIAPTFNCTAGAESGVLTLRSNSGAYPVWLGVGAYPIEVGGQWKIKQRLPAYDLQGTPSSEPVGFPGCLAGSFTPIADDYPEAEE
jgi:hypothetical protein